MEAATLVAAAAAALAIGVSGQPSLAASGGKVRQRTTLDGDGGRKMQFCNVNSPFGAGLMCYPCAPLFVDRDTRFRFRVRILAIRTSAGRTTQRPS